MLTLVLSAAIVVGPMPQDTSAVDFRAAAAAVLDSGAVWAGEIVRHASRVVVDQASFEAAALAARAPVFGGSDFVRGLRGNAIDMDFNAVKSCSGTIQPRCTLPEGTIVVQAKTARISGQRTTMTIALRWPRRGLMGFVEYDVTFVKGAIESVKQVRRS